MNPKKISLALAIVVASVCILVLSGCKKSVDRPIDEGQIALTFDDQHIDNWFDYLPLLESLHIKATFYICRYHEFTREQIKKLQKLEDEGHEIAYHTTNHPDLVKLLQSKGMEAVVNEEIKKDLTLMRKDGFNVRHFAYPFGSHNQQLNSALKHYFKTIRMVCNKSNWSKSLSKQSGELQILYGAGVDENSKLTNQQLSGLLESANNTRDCLVLTAHAINNRRSTFQVSPERLKFIASEADRLNLRFVTIDEISK